MTDIEGITNVDTLECLQDKSSEDYRKACEELMLDTNAAVKGFYDAGATQVYVFDGHAQGKNFIKDLLDPRAIQLYSDNWHEYVSGGKIDAFAEVGLHAMAGTQDAFLEHTQSSLKWFDYQINDVSCGELVQGAAYVGAYGIPLVFVSGDVAACEEAKRFIPQISTAIVKVANGRNKATSLPTKEARDLIYEMAKSSLLLAKVISPYKISLPAKISVAFQRTDYCDEFSNKYKRVGSRTVTKTIDEITTFYSLTL